MSDDEADTKHADKKPAEAAVAATGAVASIISIAGFVLGPGSSLAPALALLVVAAIAATFAGVLGYFGSIGWRVAGLVFAAVVGLAGIGLMLSRSNGDKETATSEASSEVATTVADEERDRDPSDNEPAAGIVAVDDWCDPSVGNELLVYETAGRSPVVFVDRGAVVDNFEGTDPDARGMHLVYLDSDRRQAVVVDLKTRTEIARRTFDGALSSPTVSASGAVVYVVEEVQRGTRLLRWDPLAGEVIVAHDPSGPISSPTVSDDGALVAWVEGVDSTTEILISPTDGEVLQGTPIAQGSDPSLAYADGSLLYSGPYNDGRAIYAMSTRSMELSRISTPARGTDTDPTWLPSCGSVAFVRTEGPGADIWRADIEGGESKIAQLDGSQASVSFATVAE